jgi:hypothetical protein
MTNAAPNEQGITKSPTISRFLRIVLGVIFCIAWLISSAFPVVLFYMGVASLFWMVAFLPYAASWSALICLKWYYEMIGFKSATTSPLLKFITTAKYGSLVILLIACAIQACSSLYGFL